MINVIFIFFSLLFACTATDPSNTAKIINYEFDNTDAGPYHFRFETSNGIKREEEGNLIYPDTEDEHLVMKGSFSYMDNDGKLYKVDYTADDNGFHPEGDHIKVPPFVPWIHHKHHHEPNVVKSSVFSTGVKLSPNGFNVPSSTIKPPKFSSRLNYITSSPRPFTINEFNTVYPTFVNGGSGIAGKTYIPATSKSIYTNNFNGNTLNIK